MSLTPTRGCHCKKSNCLKNYCECFQNGHPCTSRCTCISCKNTNMSYLIGRSSKQMRVAGDMSTPSSNSVSTPSRMHQMQN
mmetsp:Transcript_29607/g.34713  ORF Transcript_29607/g.34713 Transcript_29607/m.34713 type:complete len:81 (+) Transcript_29607:1356-1598(+)